MAFKRVDWKTRDSSDDGRTPEDFLLRLSAQVAERFERMTDLHVALVPLHVPGATEDPLDPGPPRHEFCRQFIHTVYCQRSWKAHLTELRNSPETHWHRCPNGQWCAFVPVVWREHCLAAYQLVCPQNSYEKEADFERQVELLDVIVDRFVSMESDYLSEIEPDPDAVPQSVGDGIATDEATMRVPTHPQVLRAMEHVIENLTDPNLTVANVARILGVNATYLAHLFSEQLGTRMSRFIARRRVERAKKLLATTNWQIKRIAFECGYSNPDWFSQVFQTYTGQSPSVFRREQRADRVR
jgi:AraC-like DNA-binding protein